MTLFFQTDQLQHFLNTLSSKGFNCVGPQIRDGAIVYDEIKSVDQLPRGYSDNQAPGSYSLTNNSSSKYFDWANGPQAIKPFLFTPREKLWQCKSSDDGKLTFETPDLKTQPIAFFGVRACDVAALKIHDQHFLQQKFVDPYYQARRDNSLVIAVNCSSPADTCFCHSTGDGPFVDDGADIVLTELEPGFLIDAQTSKGESLLEDLSLQETTDDHLKESESIKLKASKQKKQLPEIDIKSELLNNLNPGSDIRSKLFSESNKDAWNDIAKKCLSCGNCTSVCPTCFCHSEIDEPELDGKSSAHYREWDSCFTQGHSYIHGITIRAETSQRYRQWLTHKFSTWFDQYGRSGCVGCGRCISWCPVGIDVIESINEVCGGKS